MRLRVPHQGLWRHHDQAGWRCFAAILASHRPEASKVAVTVTYQPQYRSPGQSTNALAIAALVCGVVQFVTGLTFIPAIILGHMARGQIRKTGEQGDGMALAGLILGYVGGILTIVMVLIVAAIWLHLWARVTSGGGSGVLPGPSAP